MPDLINLLFSETHAWARIEGRMATVGISQYGQEELGDIILVRLPEVGRILQRGDSFGEIESVNAVEELFSPVGGVVTAVNEVLNEYPEIVNDDPYGVGWLLKIRMHHISDVGFLLNNADYGALTAA